MVRMAERFAFAVSLNATKASLVHTDERLIREFLKEDSLVLVVRSLPQYSGCSGEVIYDRDNRIQ